MKALVSLLFVVVPLVHAQTFKCPDRNGKPYYSNISCEAGTMPIGVAPSVSPSQAVTRGSDGATLLGLFRKANAESDPQKRRTLVHQAHDQMGAFQAAAAARARMKAEAEAGIPELERQLRDAQAADRGDPLYRPGMGDSSITAGIRTALGEARKQADSATDRFLRMDPEYQQVMGLYERSRQ